MLSVEPTRPLDRERIGSVVRGTSAGRRAGGENYRPPLKLRANFRVSGFRSHGEPADGPEGGR